MKAHLMSPRGDFASVPEVPEGANDVVADLELEIIFRAMAAEDNYLYEVARTALLDRAVDAETVAYRQDVLADCLKNRQAVADLYGVAADAIEAERSLVYGLMFRAPEAVLHRSFKVLDLFTDYLIRLRRLTDQHTLSFTSQGLRGLCESAAQELTDDYFNVVRGHLRELEFRDGQLISARLGVHNQGVSYLLHRRPKRDWRERLLGDRSALSFRIADRDESGARMLAQLRDRGVVSVSRTAAQSANHVLSFFRVLRAELGFYLGCLNLHDALHTRGQPICFPVVGAAGRPSLACDGLYDPALALTTDQPVVGNNLEADNRPLIVITGANQGGKSTFLRSVGVAQLMMGSGMFVCAQSFSADPRTNLFTHFKRGEDASMQSGKLDEELRRMREITDRLSRGSVVLCNESFASTNEREGSEIALQILRALVETGVKVIYVTHMFDLSQRVRSDPDLDALFLRAEREADGRRSFRVIEAPPLPTSFGLDTYRRVFHEQDGNPPAMADTPGGR